MMDEVGIVFWNSATHRGSIKRLNGTTPDGVTHDLGIWGDATEIKTGNDEHTLPYDSVEAAVRRLAQKYEGFHAVSEPDALGSK